MIHAIYIEHDIAEHPRTREILARFPDVPRIHCERYGEVFNRAAQNFRLQKRRPALILARKFDNFVLETPPGYGLGAPRNYYFSHMLNCLYDCRYCFLQGMYRSANYVLFVNYEDFHHAIKETCHRSPKEETWFFSGYDCDSLALEPITGFTADFLPLFDTLPNARLELRTKSTQIRGLLERPAMENAVVAYSLSPATVAEGLEHKAPPLERRLDALARLQAHGWPVGLRFDPLIYHDDFRPQYQAFLEQVFARVDPAGVHSVTLGAFRLPEGFYRKIIRLYPEEPLFAGPLASESGLVGYAKDIEKDALLYCKEQVLRYIPEQKVFVHA